MISDKTIDNLRQGDTLLVEVEFQHRLFGGAPKNSQLTCLIEGSSFHVPRDKIQKVLPRKVDWEKVSSGDSVMHVNSNEVRIFVGFHPLDKEKVVLMNPSHSCTFTALKIAYSLPRD